MSILSRPTRWRITTVVTTRGAATTAEASLIEDGFETVPEAAKFLSVSRAKVYAMMEQGELAYCKFGKSRRIPRRALREYAERCLVSAGTKGQT
jgi:excisionase family DNA binding protein